MNSETTLATPAAVAAGDSFASRLRGGRATLPPRATFPQIALAGLGGTLAIGLVAGFAAALASPLVLGSFGASCVLLFGFPESPFSQPRNVIFGHLFSSFVGLEALSLFGPHWWAMALAVGTALALMMATRTVHPPAGSNPVIVFLTQPGWSFLVLPTLAGALLLVVAAVLFVNLAQRSIYPKYWFGRRF